MALQLCIQQIIGALESEQFWERVGLCTKSAALKLISISLAAAPCSASLSCVAAATAAHEQGVNPCSAVVLCAASQSSFPLLLLSFT